VDGDCRRERTEIARGELTRRARRDLTSNRLSARLCGDRRSCGFLARYTSFLIGAIGGAS
jgi:hypothetical protein